jgi:hypothetical protein
MRCPIGGCVENSAAMPAPRNGLAIIKCAVLASWLHRRIYFRRMLDQHAVSPFTWADRHVDLVPVAPADEYQRLLTTGLGLAKSAEQILHSLDRFAGEFDDHVTGPQSSGVSGGAHIDCEYQRAVIDLNTIDTSRESPTTWSLVTTTSGRSTTPLPWPPLVCTVTTLGLTRSTTSASVG